MRVERLKHEYPVTVDWWPFELRPDTPPEGTVREPSSGRPSPAIAAAQAAGVPMVRTSRTPNSRPALEATEFVREHAPDAFDAFHKAVFHAYFAEDRNIGDPDVLTDVAGPLGIDTTVMRDAIGDRRYAPGVDARIQWAFSRGITSVPFFMLVANKVFAIPGAVEYPVFEQMMERLGVPKR